MGQISQFDIYWVNLDFTRGSDIAKTRPCVIVSPDELNDHLRTVIIIPITSSVKGYPYRVRCFLSGKAGEIATDQIRTVDKSRIDTSKLLGRLLTTERENLQEVLNEMFCR
jgi:mRNA interferase MazF